MPDHRPEGESIPAVDRRRGSQRGGGGGCEADSSVELQRVELLALMNARFPRGFCALLLTVLAGSCDNETHYPGPLLQGKQVGVWQLDNRNGSGGPIPDQFRRFELRSTSAEPLSEGILVDREGRPHEYHMVTDADFFFGPWLVFKDSTTGVGWEDKVWLGCVAPIDDPEDFDLLIAFERDEDGSMYPHTYERVQ